MANTRIRLPFLYSLAGSLFRSLGDKRWQLQVHGNKGETLGDEELWGSIQSLTQETQRLEYSHDRCCLHVCMISVVAAVPEIEDELASCLPALHEGQTEGNHGLPDVSLVSQVRTGRVRRQKTPL